MENKLEHRQLFSEQLSLLIEYRGISNAEVARVIKVSPGLITKYTSAKASPSYENFTQLADYFCVSMDFLSGKHYSISNELIPNPSNFDCYIESINSRRVEEKKIFEYLRLKMNNFN